MYRQPVPPQTGADQSRCSNVVNNAGWVSAVNSGNATVSATVGGTIGTSVSHHRFPIHNRGGVATVVPGNSMTRPIWEPTAAARLTNISASGTPAYSSAGMFGGTLYLDGNSTMATLFGAFPAGVPTNANPPPIAVWEKVDTGLSEQRRFCWLGCQRH